MSNNRRDFFEATLVPVGVPVREPRGIARLIEAERAHKDDLARIHFCKSGKAASPAKLTAEPSGSPPANG